VLSPPAAPGQTLSGDSAKPAITASAARSPRIPIPEMMIKRVQVLAQDPYHLHADGWVLGQKLQQVFSPYKKHIRGDHRVRRNFVATSADDLTQSQHRPWPSRGEPSPFSVPGQNPDAHLATLDQKDSRCGGFFLKEHTSGGIGA
jgi:hypothetical protein